MPNNPDVQINDQVFRELERRLIAETRKSIVVGVIGQQGSEILQRAIYTEFGTDKMPAWRWLKRSTEKMKPQYDKIGQKVFLAILQNRTPNRDVIGLWAVGKVKDFLSQVRSPRISPITAQRKGSDKPLIDTGQMRNSISYEIR
jgi:hypothetical protein